ncbi:hypothetical protein [Algoriphagus boritolerans]|uniref:hypothetical protein n=1 Tax=Algoriphagus boritolerans TaxID=308111 RepID=UPI000A4BCB41
MISTASFAQWTVSYHQSNLPFLGVNKQLGEKWLPEFRVGTDNFIDNVSLELVINHIFYKNDRIDFYGGLGGRIQSFEGLVIPVGLNIYPFERKDFGLHIEAAQFIGEGNIFRGSFGIRYRFLKE